MCPYLDPKPTMCGLLDDYWPPNKMQFAVGGVIKFWCEFYPEVGFNMTCLNETVEWDQLPANFTCPPPRECCDGVP
jgi:hypothetical protein